MSIAGAHRLGDHCRVVAAAVDRGFLKAEKIEAFEVGSGAHSVDDRIQLQAELDIPRADPHASSMRNLMSVNPAAQATRGEPQNVGMPYTVDLRTVQTPINELRQGVGLSTDFALS
ncbi:MAG: hypothetical protein PVS3B2_02850 [Candidatus Dormibacteraceae bacterium]